MTAPRALVLLRIDDRLLSVQPLIPTATTRNQDPPPPGVRLAKFGAEPRYYTAISSWKEALHYWNAYSGQRPPDLIVSDVLFNEDDSTPLNFGYTDTDIPTGLSHVKPFAAVARALDLPIGVGIHTANPSTFARIATRDDETRRMGLLAAHEAAELAAILGDGVELDGLSQGNQLDACFSWLLRRASHLFTGAFRSAIEGYRRRIIELAGDGATPSASLFVLPSDWVALADWCKRMQESPRPLTDADPGLGFRTRGGLTDCISFRSLFADYSIATQVQRDLSRQTLPPDCFALAPAAEPWKLRADTLPPIGAFVYALRSLHDTVVTAARVLDDFPVELPERPAKLGWNLTRQVPLAGSGALVRGLAIILQIVRRDHQNFRKWEDAYMHLEWNPKELSFEARAATRVSLHTILQQLEGYVALRGDSFTPEEILGIGAGDGRHKPLAEDLHDLPKDARDWYFNLLEAAGVLALDADEAADPKVFVSTGQRLGNRVPLLPSVLPKGLELISTDTHTYLTNVFGFSKQYGPGKSDNHNVIPRALADAFAPGGTDADDDDAGRDFRDEFLAGVGPEWLMELCRDYAEHTLGWTDERTWPKYLRRRVY